MVMEFRTEYSGNLGAGLKADAGDARGLRTELDAVRASLEAAGKAFQKEGARPLKTTSQIGGAWQDKDALAFAKASYQKRQEWEKKLADEKQRAADKETQAREKAENKAEEKRREKARGFGGGAKMALGALGAAAGVSGLEGLTKLALGYRGVAQLQALMYRTQLQGRQMFRGVDPTPAVRAADRFLNSIFNPASVAGRALEGILNRTFNGFFGAVEKGQPYVTAFVQGLVLGGLLIENGWLRARLALLPFTSAIADAIGPTNGLQVAAYTGTAALAGLAIWAGAAAVGAAAMAAPFVAAAAAIGAVVEQVRALKTEWDAAAIQKARLEVGSAEAEKAYGIHVGAQAKRVIIGPDGKAREEGSQVATGTFRDPSAGPKGEASGKAYADGVVKGAQGGAAAAGAAGGDIADALDKGFRAGAKIMSPSRVAEESASYWPAGVERAMDRGASRVQAASDRMVPKLGAPALSGSAPASSSGPISLTMNVTISAAGADKRSIREALDEAGDALVRRLALTLGISPDLAAGGAAP